MKEGRKKGRTEGRKEGRKEQRTNRKKTIWFNQKVLFMLVMQMQLLVKHLRYKILWECKAENRKKVR